MKKLILIMIILALVIAAFGCTTASEPLEPKEPIEEPIEKPEPAENPIERIIIEPREKLDVDDLTTLDEFEFDFDKDGQMESIKMLTAAGRGPDGEIAWDDGQDWTLIVQDSDKDYVLVDEYVQLGRIDFNIFTIDEDFYISTYSPRTASLTLNLYQYDRENDSFIMTSPYNTSGNVNMIKTSGGY